MNSTAVLLAGFAIVAVAVVVAAVSIVMRPADEPQPVAAAAGAITYSPDPDEDGSEKPLWSGLTQGDEGPLSVDERLQMVTNLEGVGESWSTAALQAAMDEDSDSNVQTAAREALLRLTQKQSPPD